MTTLTNSALILPESVSAPAAPDTGQRKLYVGNDGYLYVRGQGDPVRLTPTATEQQALDALTTPVNDIQDVADTFVFTGTANRTKKIRCANGSEMPYIARFNPDGTLDTTTQIPGEGLIGPSYRLTVSRNRYDQKITVFGANGYGENVSLLSPTSKGVFFKLNDDLSFDETSPRLVPAMYTTIHKAEYLPDGTILMAYTGTALFDGEPVNRYLTKITEELVYDPTFAPVFNGDVEGFDFQSDGKIIVWGTFSNINGTGVNRVGRLNPDGTLDTTFGAPLNAGPNSTLMKLKVLDDDTIIIAGYFSTYDGNSSLQRLVKLSADGVADPSYAPNALIGQLSQAIQNSSNPSATSIRSDGTVLLYHPNIYAVADPDMTDLIKLAPDGTIDTSISIPNNGLTQNGTSSLTAVYLLDDNTILWSTGSQNATVNGVSVSRMALLDSEGQTVLYDYNILTSNILISKTSTVQSLLVEDDGSFVVVGTLQIQGLSSSVITFDLEGLLEGSFYYLLNRGKVIPRTATFSGVRWIGSTGTLSTTASKDTLFQFMRIGDEIIGEKMGEISQ